MSEPVWHRRDRPPVERPKAGNPALHFAEPRPGAAALPRAVGDACVGLLFGLVAVFLLGLMTGIVGEEALGPLSRELEADATLRGSFGSLFVVVPAAMALLGVAGGVERLLWPRALSRQRRDEPDAVPPSRVRRRLRTTPGAMFGRVALGIGLVGVAVSLLMLGILATDSGSTDDAVTWIVLLGGLVGAAGWLLARRLWRALDRSWNERLVAARGRRGDVTRALDAERERRERASPDDGPPILGPAADRRLRRVTGIAAIPFALACVAWIVSVYARQQCRGCDPVSYDQPIEQAIDAVSLAGGIAVLLTSAALAACGLGWLVLAAMRRSAAARWVADGVPRRAPEDRLEWLLLGDTAAVGVARLLAGVAALPLMLAFTGVPLFDIDYTVSWIDVGACLLTAGGLLLAAVVVSLVDASRAVRSRNRLRAACSPGDPEIIHRAGRSEERVEFDRGGD
ncbi:hypothetical protein [Agromyces lapidis]|uniref:FtsX-like permease family protein n=1 Tax=Agromyces lapidis TaxID=279574 RepID=A0ABV5SU15_9MICO|nr:hypothetical protein [Agromyces lapidis]